MKTFHVSVDYERLALVHADKKESGDFDDWQEDTWNPVLIRLFDSDYDQLAEKEMPSNNVPTTWQGRLDTFVVKQEGDAEYEIFLEDNEPDPSIDELSGLPVFFRGIYLGAVDGSDLSDAEVVETKFAHYH